MLIQCKVLIFAKQIQYKQVIMKEQKNEKKKVPSFKNMTKSNVWDMQENDVFRLWEAAIKDSELKENIPHYIDIVKSAFELEEVKIDKPEIIKKYHTRGFKVSTIKYEEERKVKYALKKRPIQRVTDLTYENIRHITAAKLIEVLDRNFGGGWESLSQSIRDIIESAFDISTTTLPKDRIHKAGGLYEKKVNDGFVVLEIPKGLWVEAIFAKTKPVMEKLRMKYGEDSDEEFIEEHDDDDFDEEDYDDDKLTEESYRTTIETDPEDLSLDAAEVADDEEF